MSRLPRTVSFQSRSLEKTYLPRRLLIPMTPTLVIVTIASITGVESLVQAFSFEVLYLLLLLSPSREPAFLLDQPVPLEVVFGGDLLAY